MVKNTLAKNRLATLALTRVRLARKPCGTSGIGRRPLPGDEGGQRDGAERPARRPPGSSPTGASPAAMNP